MSITLMNDTEYFEPYEAEDGILIVPAYSRYSNRRGSDYVDPQVYVVCPYCSRLHMHSKDGTGHRVADCLGANGMNNKGYFLSWIDRAVTDDWVAMRPKTSEVLRTGDSRELYVRR